MMETALLLVPGDKAAETLSALLREQYPAIRATVATSCAAARRLLVDAEFDLLVISAPLQDETGVDLSMEVAGGSDTGVVLLVKTEFADDIETRVADHGVFVVEKPLHRPFFLRALRLVHAAGRRMKGLEHERAKLQDKIEEMRLINRAKCVLIEVLRLSEGQAHRYIEKQAMDTRQSKAEVAASVLKTYEQ